MKITLPTLTVTVEWKEFSFKCPHFQAFVFGVALVIITLAIVLPGMMRSIAKITNPPPPKVVANSDIYP